ncbi:MAG TPA: HYR domain-containing protein, partial [Candidatus Limnocylindrales bacterium]
MVVILAAMAVLAAAASASADTVTAQADSVHPSSGGVVSVGLVAPGATVNVDVTFNLDCAGFAHVDAGQWVVLGLGSVTVPEDGSVFATDVSIPPPGADWPVDGDACGPNLAPISSSPATLTIHAPTVPGTGYLYTLVWTRDLSPESDTDAGTFTGMASITVSLDVLGNNAPQLGLPGSVTLEGDTAGGATAAYTVSATDKEDGSLVPACAPAVGSFVALGTTTVTCTVADSGGRTATGSFDVTVVDTQAPTLVGVPAAIDLTTLNSFGADLSYVGPTATDVVDSAPMVSCNPPSGSVAPVGDSTVVCIASDASGNSTAASIPVHVTLVTPPPTPTPTPVPPPTPTPVPTPTPTPAGVVSAVWESPIGGTPPSLTANGGRSVPVKVRLYRDGIEIRTGNPILRVTPCGATEPVYEFALTWSGRWVGKLDTSAFTGPCYRVAALVDGVEAGFFRL